MARREGESPDEPLIDEVEWLGLYGSAGASPSRLDSASRRTFIDEMEWLGLYGSAGASPSRLGSASLRTFS